VQAEHGGLIWHEQFSAVGYSSLPLQHGHGPPSSGVGGGVVVILCLGVLVLTRFPRLVNWR
jgi:hypothetical protein